MKTLVILLMVIFMAGPAFAGRFDVIRYECDEFTQNLEPIRCAVPLNEGQPWLLIRILPSARSSENKKRALYLIDRTIYKFRAMGGVFFTMRTINKEGVTIERACSGVKRRRLATSCFDWHPVEGDDVFKWP